jgi:hypothetical protein
MNQFRNRLLVAAAIMAMTACGSSAAATVPSPSHGNSSVKIAGFDPCTLVTTAEASTAAGKTVANIVSLGGPSVPGACIYRASSNQAAVFVYAQVYPDSATANAVTAQQFETAMSSLLGASASNTKDVTGIGDRATEFGIKGDAGQGFAIVVYRANVVFLIAVAPLQSASTLEGMAKAAVARLH